MAKGDIQNLMSFESKKYNVFGAMKADGYDADGE